MRDNFRPFKEALFFGAGKASVMMERELMRQVKDLCVVICGLQQPPNPCLPEDERRGWDAISRQLRGEERILKKSIKKALGL